LTVCRIEQLYPHPRLQEVALSSRLVATAAVILSCVLAAPAAAQVTITDAMLDQFLRGRVAEQAELEKVTVQLAELDEKIAKFNECAQLVRDGSSVVGGGAAGGLAARAALRTRCGATSVDGMMNDRKKLLEGPQARGASASGLGARDYATVKELVIIYLEGGRAFREAELAALAARVQDLSGALRIAAVTPGLRQTGGGDGGGGGGIGGRIGGAIGGAVGARLQAFTPDMTWAYVSYLWGIMFMSGATLFEQPYQSGQWTQWEIIDSSGDDEKMMLERALIAREDDGSEWWRIKTISTDGASADTIVLETLFKPLDEDRLTMQVVRMRGRMPGETEGQELMVPQHLGMLSPGALFPFKPTPESIAGATVGTETVRISTGSYSARRVKFGSAGGSTEWWLADDAPGGVVRVQHSAPDRGGWTMAMIGAGTGARSELGIR
jgi:hypothetical protein